MLYSALDEHFINHNLILMRLSLFKSKSSINTRESERASSAALKSERHPSLQKCRLKIAKHPSAYQEPSNEHQATSSASTQSALSFISEHEACLLTSPHTFQSPPPPVHPPAASEFLYRWRLLWSAVMCQLSCSYSLYIFLLNMLKIYIQ